MTCGARLALSNVRSEIWSCQPAATDGRAPVGSCGGEVAARDDCGRWNEDRALPHAVARSPCLKAEGIASWGGVSQGVGARWRQGVMVEVPTSGRPASGHSATTVPGEVSDPSLGAESEPGIPKVDRERGWAVSMPVKRVMEDQLGAGALGCRYLDDIQNQGRRQPHPVEGPQGVFQTNGRIAGAEFRDGGCWVREQRKGFRESSGQMDWAPGASYRMGSGAPYAHRRGPVLSQEKRRGRRGTQK
jgi:hypothetical protein